MKFAKNLRDKRENLGLSAEELANRVHVSRSYITHLENGKRTPRKNLLPKIARALKLEKSMVVGWYLADQKEKLS